MRSLRFTRIGWSLFQTPLGAQLSLGTQPHYKAPSDLQVKYVKTQWLTSSEWGVPLIMAQSWLWGSQNQFEKKILSYMEYFSTLILVIILLDNWKSQSRAAEYFLYEWLLSFLCSKACHILRYYYFDIIEKISHVGILKYVYFKLEVTSWLKCWKNFYYHLLLLLLIYFQLTK